ncbi:MAG: hypothetical protein Fur0015_02640 [Ignavibacteriales bacterium]
MKNLLFFFVSIFLFYACSSSEQTTNVPQVKETYVFDDVSEKEAKDVKPVENAVNSPKDNISEVFIVQLAAFSTEDKADKFILENKSKIKYSLIKKFSEKVNLYVVQIPPFTSRGEAEKVRNELWKSETFKDAFITK